VTAYKLVKEHGSIEGVLKYIEEEKREKIKFEVPEDFDYERVRKLFYEPKVEDCDGQKFELKPLQEDELKKFLIEDKQFKEKTLREIIFKL
jgi:flap endonuclease-1